MSKPISTEMVNPLVVNRGCVVCIGGYLNHDYPNTLQYGVDLYIKGNLVGKFNSFAQALRYAVVIHKIPEKIVNPSNDKG